MSKWTEKDQRMFERLRDGHPLEGADSGATSEKKQRTLKSKAARKEKALLLDELTRDLGAGARIPRKQ